MSYKKTKVLFLIHTLGGGGAEKVLVDTANLLDKEKFDVTVMSIINTGVNIKKINRDVSYKYMFSLPKPLKPKTDSGSLSPNSSFKSKVLGEIYSFLWKVAPVRLLHKKYIKNDYDVEVAFLEGIAAKVISASKNRKSQKICWVHVDFSKVHKSKKVFISRFREKECYGKFSKIICVSKETEKAFRELIGYQDKTSVLKNVLDYSSMLELPIVEHRYPSGNGKLKIISIGRLTSQKGYDRLLRVCNKMNQEGLSAKYELTIFGEGPDKEKLQKFINEHNIFNAKLMGFSESPYAHILSSDLVVIPSRAEGQSTVMLESLILGTPLVTTDVSGTSYLPKGMIVKNNEKELFKKIKGIVCSSRRYDSLVKSTTVARLDTIGGLKKRLADLERFLCF